MQDVANPELLRYRDRMSNYGNIVRGVRERNPQSQMMFYDLFIRSVYRSAYSIVGNESEAEEIAQDTMLKVFDRIDLLNDDAGAMERIMRRIALNAAIDTTRRRKDFIFSSEDIPDSEDTEMEDDGYAFSIEEIKEAVAILSDTYRDLLTLRLFEDMSFTEIADMLKINCSTARVQYTRGIAKLRDFLIKKRSYV
ncbi:MAG: sigma-70 family RNA polymerase sigma factor [Tannerella sp.]|nr:sigma-70 family RNA polymerase sigma factor [Tannerella sp.]